MTTPRIGNLVGHSNDAVHRFFVEGLPALEAEAGGDRFAESMSVLATAVKGALGLDGLTFTSYPIAFNTTDIATGATLVTPAAGTILINARLVITEAWNSSVSDAIEAGITGNVDALFDGGNAQTEGLVAPGTDGADGVPYLFDGATAVLVTVTSAGDAATEGAGFLHLLTIDPA